MQETFTQEEGLHALTLMLRSRLFEQRVDELFSMHKMHGTTHLAIGQEAAQVGLSMGLKDSDWILPTHRNHGHTIARGADPYAMFSEMFGTPDGYCAGLGGSMHMTDLEHHNPGASAVVASGIPMAVGMALAFKRKGADAIAVAIFGDGASSRGAVHESMNLACVWKLPVLFFCENNGYGMSSPAAHAISVQEVAQRGGAYHMHTLSADGNDVEAVRNAVSEARQYISGSGMPVLLEVHTYRQCGHSKNDPRVYRSREEERAWIARCPIKALREKMIGRGQLTAAAYDELQANVRKQIDDAAKRAAANDGEHLSVADALDYVYESRPQQSCIGRLA